MMIAFWASVALLLAGALLFVLPPLLRPAAARHAEAESPMAAYRDQRAQVDAELAAGTLTPEQHAQALAELQARVIDEVGEVAEDKPAPQAPQSKAFIGSVAALISVGAIALYVVLGSPAALNPGEQVAGGGDAPHAMSQEQMETMVQSLAEKLKQNPNDANGWHMLARSYVVFQRMPEAAQAYDRAYQLNRKDPDLLADYADVLAMVNNRSLEGRPEALVKEALQLDPQHQKSLSLVGTAAFNRGDFTGAANWWTKLLGTVPPGSPQAQSVQANIDQALAEGARSGKMVPPTASVAAAPADKGAAPADKAAANPNAVVEGSVNVADAVKGSIPAGATLFVYARPADGSRMPIAIVRAPADKFPFRFKLDDSSAMSPESRISLQQQVQLVARISKTGNAMPQPGDLTGTFGPVKVGAKDAKLVISEVVK
jgi:cytochrome c-type biogenesis protein CcmH